MQIDRNSHHLFTSSSWSTKVVITALSVLTHLTSAAAWNVFQERETSPPATNQGFIALCFTGAALAVGTILWGIRQCARRTINRPAVAGEITTPPQPSSASVPLNNTLPAADSMTALEVAAALKAIARQGTFDASARPLLQRMQILSNEMSAAELVSSLNALTKRRLVYENSPHWYTQTHETFEGELNSAITCLVRRLSAVLNEIDLSGLRQICVAINQLTYRLRSDSEFTEAWLSRLVQLAPHMNGDDVATFAKALECDRCLLSQGEYELVSNMYDVLATQVPLVVDQMTQQQVADTFEMLSCKDPSEITCQAYRALATRMGLLMNEANAGDFKPFLRPFWGLSFATVNDILFDALAHRVSVLAGNMSAPQLAESIETLQTIYATLRKPIADPEIKRRFQEAVSIITERTLSCPEQVDAMHTLALLWLWNASDPTSPAIANLWEQAALRIEDIDLTDTFQLRLTIDSIDTSSTCSTTRKRLIDRLSERIAANAAQLEDLHLIAEALNKSNVRSPATAQAMTALTTNMQEFIRESLGLEAHLWAEMVDTNEIPELFTEAGFHHLPTLLESGFPYSECYELYHKKQVVKFIMAASQTKVNRDEFRRLTLPLLFVIGIPFISPFHRFNTPQSKRLNLLLTDLELVEAISPYHEPAKIAKTGLNLLSMANGIDLPRMLSSSKIVWVLEMTKKFITMQSEEPTKQRILFSGLTPWITGLAKQASALAAELSPSEAERAANVVAESGIESKEITAALLALAARALSGKRSHRRLVTGPKMKPVLVDFPRFTSWGDSNAGD